MVVRLELFRTGHTVTSSNFLPQILSGPVIPKRPGVIEDVYSKDERDEILSVFKQRKNVLRWFPVVLLSATCNYRIYNLVKGITRVTRA